MKVRLGKYPGLRSKKDRVEEIRIDPWDTWNMDLTLAQIIIPMLKQLRDTTHGYPQDFFDGDEYVDAGDIGGGFEKWKETLNEMIWAFEEILTEDQNLVNINFKDPSWKEKELVRGDKIQNGLNLFAKYYRALWD